MSTAILLLLVSWPALAAPFLFLPATADPVRRLAPWAAVPALLAAALPIDYPLLDLPWLLIGSTFEMDSTGRIFLAIAAGLWSASGIFASAYVAPAGRKRFLFFFLLTMTGNLGLTIAADGVSFYLFFALMTFAGYGLIVHRGDEEAKWAGRVYLVLAVAGEGVLLAGLLLAVEAAGSASLAAVPAGVAASASTGTITVFLLLGFAIKAGAVPLHVWLPLAHPVAPTPASAVLSGAMIKAGLLGWLRFLPLGEVAQPGWGGAVIALGMIAALFGVVVGVVQTDPKTILAYSSISQMGVMNVGVGIALASPDAAAAAVGAVTVYAAHHGIAKGALFLGVGVAGVRTAGRNSTTWVMGGLAFLALTVAGAPLTSGHFAKGELKDVLPFAPGSWVSALDLFMPVSTAATALLMLHFFETIRRPDDEADRVRLNSRLAMPWIALLGASAILQWILPGSDHPPFGSPVADLLPIVLGALVYYVLSRLFARWMRDSGAPLIAPGDILHPIERALAAMVAPVRLMERTTGSRIAPGLARRWYRLYSESDPSDPVIRSEIAITTWGPAISLVLLLFAVLFALLNLGA